MAAEVRIAENQLGATPFPAQQEQAAGREIPLAVQRYFVAGERLLAGSDDPSPPQAPVQLALKFWSPADGAANAGEAWLIGYRASGPITMDGWDLVDGEGKPLADERRSEVKDRDAAKAWRASKAMLFKPIHDARFVRIDDRLEVIAYSWLPHLLLASEQHGPGHLELRTADPSRQPVFEDEGGGKEAQRPASLEWSGTYYFMDLESDGRKEILIDRLASEWRGRRIVQESQQFVLKLDPRTRRWQDATPMFRDRLESLFQQARQDSSIARIAQLPSSREQNVLRPPFLRPEIVRRTPADPPLKRQLPKGVQEAVAKAGAASGKAVQKDKKGR